MNKNDLSALFDAMTPGEAQKARILRSVLAPEKQDGKAKSKAGRRRLAWIAVPALCLALALVLSGITPLGSEKTAYAVSILDTKDAEYLSIADMENPREDYGTSVSNICGRPELEFFIQGKDIARIEISCETEYLYAVDWTNTQHERYWGGSTFDRSVNYYNKSVTFTFNQDFEDYQDIWYRWTALNMQQWASENDYSHLSGGDMEATEDMTEEEKLALAMGVNQDGVQNLGHIQLDGYPDELTRDRITITITDRQGNSTTSVINIQVTNNQLGQTVVTASVEE